MFYAVVNETEAYHPGFFHASRSYLLEARRLVLKEKTAIDRRYRSIRETLFRLLYTEDVDISSYRLGGPHESHCRVMFHCAR